MMYDQTRRRSHISMNFDQYAAEGNRFINELMSLMGSDRNTGARVFRAIIHAIRDRLPADDAVQFAQGLPIAIKGIYFDQYDISSTPVIIRHRNEFIDFIRFKAQNTAEIDFPTDESVMFALQCVFNVLERNMSPGQINQIKYLLHSEIMEMIDPGFRDFGR